MISIYIYIQIYIFCVSIFSVVEFSGVNPEIQDFKVVAQLRTLISAYENECVCKTTYILLVSFGGPGLSY